MGERNEREDMLEQAHIQAAKDQDYHSAQRAAVVAENESLRVAIREHRDARGDDRCWLDDIELYKALGEDEVPEAMQLALPNREAFLGRCAQYWEHRQKPGCEPWKTVEALEKRIAEMASMLNKAADEAHLQVDDERDACVRKLRFLLDAANMLTPDTDEERAQAEGYARGMTAALQALEARKMPGVRWVDEMTNGSKLGEFIAAHVEQGVEEEIAKWEGRLRKAAEKAVELLDDTHPASGTLRGALDRENEQG